jgi:aminocarboxymuconate-semialdehyde decarboxylase
MIIDWHTHVHSPEEQAEPHYRGRCPATIDNVLRLHDECGLDLTVISNSGHFLKKFARNESLSFIRASNEYLASLRDRHKDKIIALAVAIPAGEDEHLKELDRAVRQDDLRGVLINSSHRGAYPDDAPSRPFFQLATQLDIPVFMHPPSVGFGEERMREFRLASSVGRPFDSCLALARLIVNGVFEEFPKLKFVASHLGGGICEVIGRMDYAYELRDDPVILGPYGPPLYITRKPSDYLRTIYFDTVCYHAPALECAIKTVGADRLIFGTDSPMLIALKQRGLDLVRQLDLGTADKEKILSGTANALLKL